MNINQKLRALGFDPSNYDAAVHAALDELAERSGIVLDPEREAELAAAADPATRVKAWWEHVKSCDACILARPRCRAGFPIYDEARLARSAQRMNLIRKDV